MEGILAYLFIASFQYSATKFLATEEKLSITCFKKKPVPMIFEEFI